MIHDFFRPVVWVWRRQWRIVVAMILCFPVLALAHGTLLRAAPAVNTQVAELPSEIRLWFNQSLEHRFSRVTVHRAVRNAVSVPVLCKDFILTRGQIIRARREGAGGARRRARTGSATVARGVGVFVAEHSIVQSFPQLFGQHR